MDVYASCKEVNSLLSAHNESQARDQLIQILDSRRKDEEPYGPLINHLIRQVGLYPYIESSTARWQDQFVLEAFKVDVGEMEPVTLHREQSSVLAKLVAGESIAVSAPTSFGKSFIIDALISIKQPVNVVIIVPTIALTDETRRRLQRKFSNKYKIITTADVELADKNIFVFPQERATHYANEITSLDLLVVDEFYKASPAFDKERASSLLDTILHLSKKAKQRYFLAPHISKISDNPFTKGMEHVYVDFNTVYLQKHELYKTIGTNEERKSSALLEVLETTTGKTLIYAGTYTHIDKVANLLISSQRPLRNSLLDSFSEWLSIHYDTNWKLTKLIKRGCGIHNGSLHRSLSQLQIHMFEDQAGLKNIISTSSIIEGVNTSAENVVIWRNKNGQANLTDFAYKNIIGRGGRMFKHFVGQIYILEPPPSSVDAQLDLELTDDVLGGLEEGEFAEALSDEQLGRVREYKEEMTSILGPDAYDQLRTDNFFEGGQSLIVRDVARDIYDNKLKWNGLGYLNSDDPENWDSMLYRVIRLQPAIWGIEFSRLVGFTKILSRNWTSTIPDLLTDLDSYDIGIDDFFKLERTVTYKLGTLLNYVNILHGKV